MNDDKKIDHLLVLIRKVATEYGQVMERMAEEIDTIKKQIKEIQENR